MSRIHRLKLLDRWLGALLTHLLPEPSVPSTTIAPISLLLIRPGGIGDAVLLVPAIRTLCNSFPQVRIDILAERRNARAFDLCPGVHEVFCYDRPGHMLAALRNRYDVVIDTEQWHRLSAVVARLVCAPVKVGFATNQRQRMFTHKISYALDDYEAVSFLRLLQPLGIDAETAPVGVWLQIPDSARKSAASLLPDNESSPLVVIFPGASIPEKHWQEDRFREVVRWCAEQGLRIVLVGGEGDLASCGRIAAGLSVANLAGSTSLAETAAIVESAAVVVSGDSGVLHIAAALGRPTVSLFGPSSAVKWGPRGDKHIVLRPANCPVCSSFGTTPPCPRNVRCMQEITLNEVTNAISTLLAARSSITGPPV